jgi:hypothetical protein
MNTIIEEGNNVQYFFPRIPAGGAHLWNVTCNDYYGNIGWSQAWTVIIIPPDFYVNRSTMKFDRVPIEGLNISLNVTVKNIGGSDATNVTVTFYRGSPSLNFVIQSFKVNLTERTGNRSTITLNTSWIVSGPGPFTFFAVADPPLATNGSIREINETNNEGNITLNVAGWHHYYGNASGNIKLENSGNASNFLWNVTGGNVYIVETGTSISWQDIYALGRDVNDIAMFNDFKEADTALNMTGYMDSINATFTYNHAPKQVAQFSVYQTQIANVPIVNSTNSSNFITGILWDSSDLMISTFNGTQDLVFITEVNNGKQGKYGIYDYEIRVPAALDTYKLGSGGVTFYTEII